VADLHHFKKKKRVLQPLRAFVLYSLCLALDAIETPPKKRKKNLLCGKGQKVPSNPPFFLLYIKEHINNKETHRELARKNVSLLLKDVVVVIFFFFLIDEECFMFIFFFPKEEEKECLDPIKIRGYEEGFNRGRRD